MAAPAPRRQRGIRSDLLWFVSLRVFSGVLSFFLFALLARWFGTGETKSLYYFLFLAGFFTSVLRALASIAASLHGYEARTTKLRRACIAFGHVVCAALAMLPVAVLVFSGLGTPLWAFAGLMGLVLFWGVDIDLVRAIVGRPSLVAVANVVGAVLTIGCLALFRSYEGAFAAILLQWLPLCGLNAYVLFRLRRRILPLVRATLAMRGLGVWGPLAVALFDGLVLNAPFFFGDRTPPELGRSIGVVTRIFVATLILMPLVTYWSNGAVLTRLATRAGLSAAGVYWCLVMGSGLTAGAAFALAFTWIAGAAPTQLELSSVFVLLLGYGCYATAGRYRAGVSSRIVFWLVGLALMNLLGVLTALALDFRVLGIAMVQASSLLVAAGLMALPRR